MKTRKPNARRKHHEAVQDAFERELGRVGITGFARADLPYRGLSYLS